MAAKHEIERITPSWEGYVQVTATLMKRVDKSLDCWLPCQIAICRSHHIGCIMNIDLLYVTFRQLIILIQRVRNQSFHFWGGGLGNCFGSRIFAYVPRTQGNVLVYIFGCFFCLFCLHKKKKLHSHYNMYNGTTMDWDIFVSFVKVRILFYQKSKPGYFVQISPSLLMPASGSTGCLWVLDDCLNESLYDCLYTSLDDCLCESLG